MDSKEDNLKEINSRYCPICDNFIKIGSPLHYCNDKDIEKIDNPQEEDFSENKTFSDILEEFEEHYNPDTYYDKETE